jgi:hypothetical protein
MDLRTLQQKEVLDLVKTPISDKSFIKNYNRAIQELALLYNSAKKELSEVIVCEDTATEYHLNSAGEYVLLGISRVLDENKIYFKNFRVRDNSKILFNCQGTYTVYELFEPDKATSMDDEIIINPVFNRAIAHYIASKELKNVDPETASEMNIEFYRLAALANKSIREINNPNRTVKAGIWR